MFLICWWLWSLLSHYAKFNHGSCQDTVNRWIEKAKTDWLDAKDRLIGFFLG